MRYISNTRAQQKEMLGVIGAASIEDLLVRIPAKARLSRPLNLVTRSLPEGVQKRLVDYAVSRAVNDLHEKHGFVPFED